MVADNWSIDFKQLRTDFDKPRFTIKLCQSLKSLNPNDKLSINDWLIKFRAGRVARRRETRSDKLFDSSNAGPHSTFSRGRAAFRCVSPIEGERPGP